MTKHRPERNETIRILPPALPPMELEAAVGRLLNVRNPEQPVVVGPYTVPARRAAWVLTKYPAKMRPSLCRRAGLHTGATYADLAAMLILRWRRKAHQRSQTARGAGR